MPTSHKQRLRAAIAGETTDRVPLSLWGHDFGREWSAADLAAATIENYRRYNLDLVKVNPRFTYYFEAWGGRYEPTGTSQPTRLKPAISKVEDLATLAEIDPTTGPFGEQLDALRQIVHEIGGEVDVIQTVFNPLTVASNLLGMTPPEFVAAATADSTSVHAGLARLARVLGAYSKACLDAGASGMFFATVDWGTHNNATPEFYREYGRPYDLQVLAAIRSAPVNVLHVCRDNNMLNLLSDYPVAIFNWDVHGAGNASLSEFARQGGKAVMGGIDRRLLRQGNPDDVRAQVQRDIATKPGRFIAGPGCSVDPAAPPANLEAAVSVVRA